jgi:membrane fusion protein (multidrug efflux system)
MNHYNGGGMRTESRMVGLSLALIAAVTVAACSKNDAGAEGEGGEGGPPGGFAMPVEVAVARRDTVVDALQATGQIEAIQSIELKPEIEGRVTAILIREGQTVGQGTPLFRIDDAELKAQVARAEADWDLANQALKRTRDLLAQNASSAADLEQAEATERSTRAQMELLKVRQDRTTVRAPFSGVVGRRSVSLGDYVTTSSTLISLQTVDPQRATFQVPERYAEKLQQGQRVQIRVAALQSQEFTGVVDFVDPVVQLPARTILVKAQVPNGRRQLQSGMFIEARLATETRPNAVLVPEEAIVPMQGANFVWVVVDGKAARRQVGIGIRIPGFVEIRSGVDEGEQVVVGGMERIAMDGMPVNAAVVDRTPAVPGESVPSVPVDSSPGGPPPKLIANSFM